jgi:ubiquinone/menaquinone biosynthesis C-methylase UbiE
LSIYGQVMTNVARYDEIADFYVAGWSDTLDDSVSACLFGLLGPVAGLRVLEIACGHGRISRKLARQGAQVIGVDISQALVSKAEAAEREGSLGIRYIRADVAELGLLDRDTFDVVVCSFGLSDIDDLEGAVRNVSRVLCGGGVFVCSLLHPCVPGGQGVSGSWPVTGAYHDEGWWRADGELSSLRRQVGANHRTLTTYFNTFRRHGLWLDEVAEPMPDSGWTSRRADAARFPVFLAARCVKSDSAVPGS